MKPIKTIMCAFALTAMTGFAYAETTDAANVLPVMESITQADEVTENHNPKAKFPRGLQFGIGVSGTSGLNGFIGYANKDFESFWWKRLGVRFDFATMSPIKSNLNKEINSAIGDNVDIDGIYLNDFDISGKHYAALVDFYPFGNTWFLGGIRITGGYVFGDIKMNTNLTANIDGLPDAMEFELDDKLYRYNGGDVKGMAGVNWKYRGPYLGTGFDLGLFWGIKIYMDAGVVFTSKTAGLNLDVPLTTLLQVSHDDGTTWANVDGVPSLETEFNKAKADALKDAQDELNKIKAFPLIKLGFMYRF